jgi:hypothetical protein
MMWRKRRIRPKPISESVIRYGPEPKERRHWADILEDAIKRGARGLLDNYEIMALWVLPVWLVSRYPPSEAQPGWALVLYSVSGLLALAGTIRRMK